MHIEIKNKNSKKHNSLTRKKNKFASLIGSLVAQFLSLYEI